MKKHFFKRWNCWKVFSIVLFILVMLFAEVLSLLYGKIIKADWVCAVVFIVLVNFWLSSFSAKQWKRTFILIVVFGVGIYTDIAFPNQLIGGPLIACGIAAILFDAVMMRLFPKMKNSAGKKTCFACLFILGYLIGFPLWSELKDIEGVRLALKRQKLVEIQFIAAVNHNKAEFFFPDEVAILTEKERSMDFYGYVTIEKGRNRAMLVSPYTGRIIVQKYWEDSPELKVLMLEK
ncbi:hypothetical protein [Holdemania massiliensis]|uniref:hypothetical protein n=1 Tax=Holdemania massiliensis TaxID=1468449 RepID=UPI001F06940C|nr:hypothetical protein [Holdemania massiliensis]MCH1941752.1 hypothetical protein [Holdemania massiliensis]